MAMSAAASTSWRRPTRSACCTRMRSEDGRRSSGSTRSSSSRKPMTGWLMDLFRQPWQGALAGRHLLRQGTRAPKGAAIVARRSRAPQHASLGRPVFRPVACPPMCAKSRGPEADNLVRGLCALGIALGLAMRLALPFALPLGDLVRNRLQGLNDEPAHLRYVEYVATRHDLPVQMHRFEEPGAFGRADFEFHQPPLYYILAAPLYSLAGPGRGLLACRLFSALCGLATLVLLWRLLRSSPLPGFVIWPAMMFATLWLRPAYFCAVVSNDALSWLIGAGLVALLWVRPGGRPGARRAVALGVLLGLGLLTKSTLLVFLPAVLIVG